MSIETKNAVIKSANITNDDHGFLSIWIHLDYGDSGQGFGGYALYSPNGWKPSEQNRNYCGHFIWRVLEVVGVIQWDDLPGKTVRATCEHSKVHSIGHIVKDIWFDPKKEFEEMQAHSDE